MTGAQYGTALGSQYGTAEGSHYGALERGTRVELREPGSVGPDLALTSALSVDIGLEHTAASDMVVELPPHAGITEERFVGGRLDYSRDGRLLFAIEITGIDIAEDRTLSVDGMAVEDAPLMDGSLEYSFSDTRYVDAIRTVVGDIQHATTVDDPPSRPVRDQTVQTADLGEEFASILTAGADAPDDASDFAREFYPAFYEPPAWVRRGVVVPSLHPTTPARVDIDGLQLTQTTQVIEAEDYVESNNVVGAGDSDASGGESIIITEGGDAATWEFAFEHAVPPGQLTVSFRAFIGTAGSAEDVDRFTIRVDGSDVATYRSGQAIAYPDTGGYNWSQDVAVVNAQVDARDVADGDEPHTVEIEKVEGDDEIVLDCVVVADDRHAQTLDDGWTTDANGALPGPWLYPRSLRLVFDGPGAGMAVDRTAVSATFDREGPHQAAGVVYPGNETIYLPFDPNGGTTVSTTATGGDGTTRVYGIVALSHIDETPAPTTTPTQGTRGQKLTEWEMRLSGDSVPIIGERDFSGDPMSILQTLHQDSNRRFVTSRGTAPGETPTLHSFPADGTGAKATGADNWIVTDTTRDSEAGEFYNKIVVVGAAKVAGSDAHYRGVATDDASIESLKDPPYDDGVRLLEVDDSDLVTDNDCRSKARALLAKHSRQDVQGGDVTAAPVLPVPGKSYQTTFFTGDESVGGWGNDWGQSWGGTSTGTRSVLESASYQESPGTAETTMAFERVGGLFRVLSQFDESGGL